MIDENAELKKYFTEKGEKIANTLKDQLRKKKKIATGNTINSVESTVEQNEVTTLLVLADEDISFILGGRGKNKKVPPIEDIEKWVKAKGIKAKGNNKLNTRSLPWAISRGIKDKGIRGVNVKSFAKKEDQTIYEETKALLLDIRQKNFVEMAANELKNSGLPVSIK
jgi:hypothetical protein